MMKSSVRDLQRTPHICCFAWATTFAMDEPRVIYAGICGYDLFDLDAMAPVVLEIISVGKAGYAALDELAHAHMGGIAGADREMIAVQADTMSGIADIETEQVVFLEPGIRSPNGSMVSSGDWERLLQGWPGQNRSLGPIDSPPKRASAAGVPSQCLLRLHRFSGCGPA